ncbi:MAG TPA: A24 family peptidase [Caulobacteraceae bacterium]
MRFGFEVLAAATLLGPPAGWFAWRVTGAYEADKPRPSAVIMTLAVTAAFSWAAAVTPPGWVVAASLILAWGLVCLATIDAIAFRLPDSLTFPLIAAGLAGSFALPDAPVLDHLAGAAGGYAVLAGLAWAWRRWRGEDGIGMGDAKLLAAAGAWLGWRPLPSVVVIACAAALVWIVIMALARRAALRGARVAFGIPLSLATWIVWLYGPLIA